MKIKTIALFSAVVCALQAGTACAIDVPVAASKSRIRAEVRSLKDNRWRNVLRQGLDVSCGTAALGTIMHYEYGDPVSEQELIRGILKHIAEKEVRRRGGFSL